MIMNSDFFAQTLQPQLTQPVSGHRRRRVCQFLCVNGVAVFLDLVDSVTVVNGERVEYGFPAACCADEVLPVFPAFDRGEVEHLHRGLLGWEMPAVTDRPPKPRVQRFDRVRGVHNLSQLDWELEKRDELGPIGFP